MLLSGVWREKSPERNQAGVHLCVAPLDIPRGYIGTDTPSRLCDAIVQLLAWYFAQHGPCHVCFVNVPLRDSHGTLVEQLRARGIAATTISIRCIVVSVQAPDTLAPIVDTAAPAYPYMGGTIWQVPVLDPNAGVHPAPESYAGYIRVPLGADLCATENALLLRLDIYLAGRHFPVEAAEAVRDVLRAHLSAPGIPGPVFLFAALVVPPKPPAQPRAVGRLAFGGQIAALSDFISVCGQLYHGWNEARRGSMARAVGNMTPFLTLVADRGGWEQGELSVGPSRTGTNDGLLELFDPQGILSVTPHDDAAMRIAASVLCDDMAI